jgi:site-specific recombinase XerD
MAMVSPTSPTLKRAKRFTEMFSPKVMGYHVQPTARKLGITKRIGWHTFRRTYSSILQDNGEDVKVVQELLRHASTKVTLDVYAQALTPTKRAAQRKVVQMIRGESRCTASVPREIGTSV